MCFDPDGLLCPYTKLGQFHLIHDRITLSVHEKQSSRAFSSGRPNYDAGKRCRSHPSKTAARDQVQVPVSRFLEAVREKGQEGVEKVGGHPGPPGPFSPAAKQVSGSDDAGMAVDEDDGVVLFHLRQTLQGEGAHDAHVHLGRNGAEGARSFQVQVVDVQSTFAFQSARVDADDSCPPPRCSKKREEVLDEADARVKTQRMTDI